MLYPTTNYRILSILILFFVAFVLGCSQKEIEGCTDPGAVNYDPAATKASNCTQPLELSQEMVNSQISKLHRRGITGVFSDPANNLTLQDSYINDNTIRDIFSNVQSLTGNVLPGTLIARVVYEKLPDNKYGKVLQTTIAFKQKDGYNPDSHDFEYIVINGESTISKTNRFGLIPTVRDNQTRGKISACASCHNNKVFTDGVITN